MCEDLGVQLYELTLDLPRVLKHPCLLLWTVGTLIRLKPRGVIVQNPSLLLALLVVVLRYVLNYSVVVDAHNEAISPFQPKWKWIMRPSRYLQKVADLTIVTNHELADIVKRNYGRPFILQDKLPKFPYGTAPALRGSFNVVCICTFAKDEPVLEVVEAARRLDRDYAIYVTGNYRGNGARVTNLAIPPNVILTGYLPEDEYIALLRGADVILDLTYMDDCLVCGAYEAVALGKPMIVSDSKAAREYFYKGAVYVSNEPSAIAKAIQTICMDLARYESDVRELRRELEDRWAPKREEVLSVLETLTGTRPGSIQQRSYP